MRIVASCYHARASRVSNAWQRLNESDNVVVIFDLLYGISSIWWRATAKAPASVAIDGSGDASGSTTDGEVAYEMVF